MTVIVLSTSDTARVREIEARTGLGISEAMAAAVRKHRSIKGAARELGISRPTFYDWMRKFDVSVEFVSARPQ